jgi:hypothetical protein
MEDREKNRLKLKSILFCTTTVYFIPFSLPSLKKEGRRKGE